MQRAVGNLTFFTDLTIGGECDPDRVGKHTACAAALHRQRHNVDQARFRIDSPCERDVELNGYAAAGAYTLGRALALPNTAS